MNQKKIEDQYLDHEDLDEISVKDSNSKNIYLHQNNKNEESAKKIVTPKKIYKPSAFKLSSASSSEKSVNPEKCSIKKRI